MIKRKTNISINVVAVLATLLCLLVFSVGVGNAWFMTTKDREIHLIVNVGELRINLYQVKDGQTKEVYTNAKNSTEATPSFVVISGEILPDVSNDLVLKLENTDAGANVYVKFKFNLYACGHEGDTLVSTNLTLGSNIVKDGDYYWYNDGTNNKEFKDGDTIELLTGFTVPFDSFKNFNNSETLKLDLQIEYINVE